MTTLKQCNLRPVSKRFLFNGLEECQSLTATTYVIRKVSSHVDMSIHDVPDFLKVLLTLSRRRISTYTEQ